MNVLVGMVFGIVSCLGCWSFVVVFSWLVICRNWFGRFLSMISGRWVGMVLWGISWELLVVW